MTQPLIYRDRQDGQDNGKCKISDFLSGTYQGTYPEAETALDLQATPFFLASGLLWIRADCTKKPVHNL